jgi:hypothetical protein
MMARLHILPDRNVRNVLISLLDEQAPPGNTEIITSIENATMIWLLTASYRKSLIIMKHTLCGESRTWTEALDSALAISPGDRIGVRNGRSYLCGAPFLSDGRVQVAKAMRKDSAPRGKNGRGVHEEARDASK